jgi:hypothetical protein
MSLHPELAKILDQFNGLIDDVEAGNILYQDALQILNSLSCVDSDGFLWSIDSEGIFYKAYPGESPKAADPTHFKSGYIEFAPKTGHWGGFDIDTPPLNPFKEFSDNDSEDFTPFDESDELSRANKRGGNNSTDIFKEKGGFIKPLLRGNKKTIIVVVFGFLLITVGFLGSSNGPTNSIDQVEESNVESSLVDGESTVTDDTIDTTPTKGSKGKLATKVDLMYISETLISNEQFIRELLIAKEDTVASSLWSAIIHGSKEAELKVTSGFDVKTQTVSVKITTADEVILRDTIKVIYRDNEFLLERFPKF